MNNREEWSDTERSIQTMIEKIQKEYPDFWKETPSPSEDIRYLKRYQKKLRSRRRRMNMAACFACVVIFGSGMALWLDSSAAYGVKFALEKRYFEVTGLVSATDPERVSDENSMAVTIQDESQIETYKKFWDGLMIPGYIPEGYEFRELYIGKYNDGLVMAQYTYKNDNNDLIINMSTQREENGMIWSDIERINQYGKDYLVTKDEITNTITVSTNLQNKTISISSKNDSEDQIVKIIKEME